MKAAAFVCVLALSLCLSQQASTPSTNVAPIATTSKPDEKAQVVTTSTEKTQEKPGAAKPDTTLHNTSQTAPVEPHPTEKANPPATTENKTENKTETAPTKDSKTTEAPKTDADNKKKPNNETTTGDKKIDVTVKPADKDKKLEPTQSSTETALPSAKSTEAPKDTTEKPMVAARGFDGASFFGGIVLTLGLLAIGFIGFKYYKNQTERNYHTL